MLLEVMLNDPDRTVVTILVHPAANLDEHWTGTVTSPRAPAVGEHLATARTDPVSHLTSYVTFHGRDVIGTPFR